MPLWTNADNANGVPIFAPAQFKVTPNTANRDALFGNTTADALITGQTISVYSVSDAEMNSANTSSEASLVTHTGWNIRTEGSGGRAGRIHYECLVAGGTAAGANTTIDDAVFPD